MTHHMTDGPLVLVLDIGTTGGRVILIDQAGEILGMAYREYQSVFHAPTVIDHDPATWLLAIEQGIAELRQTAAQLWNKVRAISIATQRATIVPVDENGIPLAHAILWQDKRPIEESKQIEERLGQKMIYERTGLKIDPYFSLPKIMWFRNHKPEIYARTACFLTVHDYLVHALTGEFKTDWTQASRTMLFNIHEFAWDRTIAEAMNVDLHKMPEAYPTGTIAGNVTNAAADRFGLQAGTPVVMAGGDQQCAAVGLGAIRPGIVKVTTGTGSFVVAPTARPIRSADQKVVCSASAVLGQWVIEAGIFTTGSTYRWLRDFLGTDGSYDALNQQAEMSAPGANGLFHIPHYAGSAAPYWNANASGLLFNLSLGTKKSDVVRAYLEGICFEIQKNLNVIDSLLSQDQKADHIRLTAVHVSGGLARLDLFNQIQADIYGLVVIPDQTEQATSLGAAMIAFTALGLFPDLNEAHKKMGRLDLQRMKTANREMKDIYREMAELHHAIYEALNKERIYERARRVTEKLNALHKRE
ncbi:MULTISPECIES: FGGY-family carbohydrate kinase [Paenibacillus]|uniref:FGGY-family carbohydrate kinase n=1 Tax=Paenibacillus TaxID=44249 RepID=UPI001576224A|nr:FGGY-family carbohydrate kinase [Paenibacillus sp. JMULE4]NTZ18123.1 carbohydrate kinase [Paenibacillus sp. JMULE4]